MPAHLRFLWWSPLLSVTRVLPISPDCDVIGVCLYFSLHCRTMHRGVLLPSRQHGPSRGGVRQRDGVLPRWLGLAVCCVVGLLLQRRCQRVHSHDAAAVSRGIVLCRWRASAVPVGKVLGCSGRCRVHAGLLLPLGLDRGERVCVWQPDGGVSRWLGRANGRASRKLLCGWCQQRDHGSTAAVPCRLVLCGWSALHLSRGVLRQHDWLIHVKLFR